MPARASMRILFAPLVFCAALTLALFNTAGPAHAADDPKAFVSDVSERAIAIISDSAASMKQREDAFRDLLRETADLDRIAAFALGQYLRTPGEAQRNEYRKLVETFIVKVYVTRLSDYNDEKLDVLSAQMRGDNQAIVKSEIRFTNGREPVTVDWWLVKSGDGYKIFDVNVVGIWLAQEQRSTFSSVIRNNGGNFDSLLEHLRAQIGKAEKGDLSGIASGG
ncbi:MAG: ABC transporter substrate-binding protein [Parvibaculum sp.]|uniref:phospholipid-binding protein MlaC n=1 Tax=Parvibaculum sp. TaxID=2024848 RepID=UPI0034A0A7E1